MKPAGNESMAIWMVSCIELSVLSMFPFQEYFLKLLGQKNYMLIGLVILVLTNFGISFIDIFQNVKHSMHVGLTNRILQGIGICMTQTAILSLTCVLFESEKLKYMGFISSAMGVGEVVAPFAGSMLYGVFGFVKQFLAINFIVIILIVIIYKIIPGPQTQNLSVSLGHENEGVDQSFYKNIFKCRSIVFDILALCFINIFDCVHVGFFPTILNEFYDLKEEYVGLIYGMRGISFVLACIIIPYLKLPPKLQHLIGISLESLSLALMGCSQLLGLKYNIYVVGLGFVIQGLGSPCIMVSALPSMIDGYIYEYDLNPILHNKTYSHLCDTFSNICELIFALFFLLGSFSGQIMYDYYKDQFTFNFFFIFGIITFFIFLAFDCGTQPFKDNQKKLEKLERQRKYLEIKQD